MRTPLLHLAAHLLLYCGSMTAASAQVDVFTYIEPKAPFHEAAAKAQLEPGTGTIRGTIYARENRALVASLNMSQRHPARLGTVVTLMPHSAYLEEWIAMNKKMRRKGGLEKPAISRTANAYRILTKVTDDRGSFKFTGLKPGRYLILAEVEFVKDGSTFVQTGAVTTSNAATGQILDSRPVGYHETYYVDVTKLAIGTVTLTSEGQVVETTISGQ
ncbi:MAG: hypothetical protein IAE82_16370 [Opitutaceae bacterium]|nr:hypothetical protein [Opitutaceae bacterium]